MDRRTFGGSLLLGTAATAAGGAAAAPARPAGGGYTGPGSDFQAEKAVVRALHDELAAATPQTAAAVLARHTTPDWRWRGMHPFNEQTGPEAVAAIFWAPFLQAMTRVQRRPDVFVAGRNDVDGGKTVWVAEMGHLMALFDRPWLGIRPTQRIVMLRFVEWNRVEGGRIAETALFCDIPHLMIQAGQNPFPPQTGALLVQPGPRTHEGLNWDRQDPAHGTETMRCINALLHNPPAKKDGITEVQRLQRVWRDDMIWWGPAGIGATYTLERYDRQHSLPWDKSVTDYHFNGHLARVAEGSFGGFFGWANLTLRNAGGFMGMDGGGPLADMRVVDMYRAQDGKLAENWVFIDMLHFHKMQGLDVLQRMRDIADGGG